MSNQHSDSLQVVLVVFATAGCATSSGVTKTGTDTYTITTSASPGRGGVPAAKGAALKEASSECGRNGLQLSVVSATLASPTWTEGMAIATIDFRCTRP